MRDLKQLNTEELDGLIVAAAEERAERKQPFPVDPPTANAFAILNPRCEAKSFRDGIVIQVVHAGFGWVTIVLGNVQAAKFCGDTIAAMLVKGSAGDFLTAVPTSDSSGGGKSN